MNEHRKSDGPEVPLKSLNKAGQPVAEEADLLRGLWATMIPTQTLPD